MHCLGNQDKEDLIRSSILRQNLSDEKLKLDPLLRKALLKALVELEKEAEEKLRAEETRSIRSEPSSSAEDFLQNNDDGKQEIQSPAESNFPGSSTSDLTSGSIDEGSTATRDTTEGTNPNQAHSTFQYSTSSVEGDGNNLVQESKSTDSTVHSTSIESNLISEDLSKEKLTEETNNSSKDDKKEGKDGEKSKGSANEVDIFKAPLVAAFTLHQDSKGTPHSVIPLFSKEQNNHLQRQQYLQQQYALLKQQQQQQFLQNQFIPGVTITPASQLNQFSQPAGYFVPSTVSPNFSPSSLYPPLVSNSVLSQNFQGPTTASPFNGNQQNFITTLPPQRNFSPELFSQTILPSQDFNSVSVVQSHSINLTPTPGHNFHVPVVTPAPGLQPLSIPPVTLPLQNEARFQSPIIVPSVQTNPSQAYLNTQEQERIRNGLAIEEQTRKRIIEEQNRQRQFQQQNRQRQLEEERQRQLYEAQNRLRQQRQEQSVDFQRSVGFSFNQNSKSNFRASQPVPQAGFNYHIQPSQGFPVNFASPQTRHRVNRQEGFTTTGNYGFNANSHKNFGKGVNRPQYQSNQVYTPLSRFQEYRTIPEEYYRNTPINQFPHNRFPRFEPNNFGQNNPEDVNKRLRSLLYQSGVAVDPSGQEDLNIVSKVLALNHERSDSNVEETILRNERFDLRKSSKLGDKKIVKESAK